MSHRTERKIKIVSRLSWQRQLRAFSRRTRNVKSMQPMEVLLSAMLVRRTELADGSTRQLEHRSDSERLAGRSVCQSGSGFRTGRRSRHRRSAASAVSRSRIGQGVGILSYSDPDRPLLVLPCRCPPRRAKRRMLADVLHWRQNRSAARRIMRVHR